MCLARRAACSSPACPAALIISVNFPLIGSKPISPNPNAHWHASARDVQRCEARSVRGGFCEGAAGTAANRRQGCVRRAQEARLQSLAMQLAESDCTLRVYKKIENWRQRWPPNEPSRNSAERAER